MTEHWQAEAGRSRETASPPTEKSTTHDVLRLQPIAELDVPDNSDENLRWPVSSNVRNDELHDQGPIASLSRPLMETLGLLLIDVRMKPDVPQYCGPLESICAAFFFWIDDFGMSRGCLDDVLQNSLQLRDTRLAVLVSISRFLSTCT
jgi:hypothetical protein